MEIYGIRSIIEAIESSKEISKVYLLKSNSPQSSLLRSLIILLERKNIKSSFVPKEKFRKYNDKNHQGAVAILSPVSLLSIEDLISTTFDEKNPKTYLLLDGVTDTRNFGAIIRTAAITNADTIVVSTNNSAPINNDVIKTSAGGVFKIPISKVDNLKDAIYLLKSSNIDIIAITEKAKDLIYNYKLNKPLSIILGAEDKGISKGILKIIDNKAKIPMKKTGDSLNVSVACGIALYEIIRQRQ